jgi:hypothetical protein
MLLSQDRFSWTGCSAAAKSNFRSSGFCLLFREGFCDSHWVPLFEIDHSSLSSMVECRLRSESWPAHEPRPGRKRMRCSCDISSDPSQASSERISANIHWVIAHEIENVGIRCRLDALSSASAIAKIAKQVREIAAVFGNFSAYFVPQQVRRSGKSKASRSRNHAATNTPVPIDREREFVPRLGASPKADPKELKKIAEYGARIVLP